MKKSLCKVAYLLLFALCTHLSYGQEKIDNDENRKRAVGKIESAIQQFIDDHRNFQLSEEEVKEILVKPDDDHKHEEVLDEELLIEDYRLFRLRELYFEQNPKDKSTYKTSATNPCGNSGFESGSFAGYEAYHRNRNSSVACNVAGSYTPVFPTSSPASYVEIVGGGTDPVVNAITKNNGTNYALRINDLVTNNDHRDMTKLRKPFVIQSTGLQVMSFKTAIVAMDVVPDTFHNQFITARILDNSNNVVAEYCDDFNSPLYPLVEDSYQLFWSDWTCREISFSGIQGQMFFFEIIVSDCSANYDNVHVYVDDICNSWCASQGVIEIDSINPCDGVQVTANFSVPRGYTINPSSIVLSTYQNGSLIGSYSTGFTISGSTISITLPLGTYPSTDFDIGLAASFSNSNGISFVLSTYDVVAGTNNDVDYDICCKCGNWGVTSYREDSSTPIPFINGANIGDLNIGSTYVFDFNYFCNTITPCNPDFTFTSSISSIGAIQPQQVNPNNYRLTINVDGTITGAHWIEVTPVCNGKICLPFKVYFNIDCCGDYNSATLQTPSGNISLINTTALANDLHIGDNYSFTFEYDCLDTDCGLRWEYETSLSGITLTSINNSFTVNYTGTTADMGTIQYLTVTPKCGSNICEPFSIQFFVGHCECGSLTHIIGTEIPDGQPQSAGSTMDITANPSVLQPIQRDSWYVYNVLYECNSCYGCIPDYNIVSHNLPKATFVTNPSTGELEIMFNPEQNACYPRAEELYVIIETNCGGNQCETYQLNFALEYSEVNDFSCVKPVSMGIIESAPGSGIYNGIEVALTNVDGQYSNLGPNLVRFDFPAGVITSQSNSTSYPVSGMHFPHSNFSSTWITTSTGVSVFVPIDGVFPPPYPLFPNTMVLVGDQIGNFRFMIDPAALTPGFTVKVSTYLDYNDTWSSILEDEQDLYPLPSTEYSCESDYLCFSESTPVARARRKSDPIKESGAIVEESFKVSPNPASDMFKIQGEEGALINKIEVFDKLGKRVYSQTFDNQITVNVNSSNWASGMYTVQINGKLIEKVVIE